MGQVTNRFCWHNLVTYSEKCDKIKYLLILIKQTMIQKKCILSNSIYLDFLVFLKHLANRYLY